MSTDSDTKHEEIKSLLNTIDANLDSVVAVNANHGSKIFSTAGTYSWNAPTGVNMVYIVATGGTGGGGGGSGGSGCSKSTNIPLGAGGGSGGCSQVITAICGVTPGSTYTIVVGAGGAGGAGGAMATSSGIVGSPGSAGGAGGATKFGEMLVINGANGGQGGKVGTYQSYGADGSSYTAAGIASGGTGGALSTSSLCHVLHTYSAVTGNGCAETGVKTQNYYEDGTAGAASVRTILNRSSGKGGAGGRTSSNYYANYPRTDGEAGAGGSCGYMRIIW